MVLGLTIKTIILILVAKVALWLKALIVEIKSLGRLLQYDILIQGGYSQTYT